MSGLRVNRDLKITSGLPVIRPESGATLSGALESRTTSRRSSFVAEGGHGIEPRRAVRRQIAGENGHGGESNGGEQNRQRVVRLEAEEHRARGFAQGQ